MVSERFRPMLAASLPTGSNDDLARLNWSGGFWISPKLDGIRAIKSPEGLVSRTLKPIPNKHVQALFAPRFYDNFDGELIIGKWDEPVNFNDVQSAIMSQDGKPDVTYCVFDDITDPLDSFYIRNNQALERIRHNAMGGLPHVMHLEQVHVKNVDALLEYEESILAMGFEGVILRSMYAPYKNNRSTFKQQGMIKLKRFTDAEAEIIGFEELYRNLNEATTDRLGYTKRSGHNANMHPAGTLGLFRVRGINGQFAGVEFGVGSGLDDALRSRIWESRESYLGKVIKYKFQAVGSKDKPRLPIFLGFRSKDDM